MDAFRPLTLLPLAAALALGACAGLETTVAGPAATDLAFIESRHAGDDDLLTAGLGAPGLRSPLPPAFADPLAPTAAELRRRAIWSNWRGIADLAPGGGFGEAYGSLAPVAGREFHAFARVPGGRQPHRVLVQLPDDFDAAKRCVVVAAASGSRGVYGAIALAGSWGLPSGCAVAYTDKGAGTGYVAGDAGVRLDGTRAVADEAVEFEAPAMAGITPTPIATKHAHSGDNPEADWGRHVDQAAQFALQVLAEALPAQAPFTAANTRVIAVGVSNGGGAVLRAAESRDSLLDGVVSISPNVLAGEGGRSLYDYVTEAALWQPCALNAAAFDSVALARPGGARSPLGAARCASLQSAGMLPATATQAPEELARVHLLAQGWNDEAIAAGALSTAFDLWRAVAVTYASSYARTGPTQMPCGFRFHALDANGQAREPTPTEVRAWWSDASGIPPGAGVGLVDPGAIGADPTFAGLQCLRALQQADDALAQRVREGVAATRATLPRADLPVLVMHGADDGLVPEAFSGGAYAGWAKAAGRDVAYWRIGHAQHFDAFLGLPPLAARYVPMLPYAYRGLDAMWAHLADGAPAPTDEVITPVLRSVSATGVAPHRVEDRRLPQ